ncbi:MAG: right-handed parallel beta-helix repeat-containing protein [Thermoplasmata archaeon]|nr:MAG: right-handed parallel beta-helix repeat-containing protein [Thermoplasmata archaeon]
MNGLNTVSGDAADTIASVSGSNINDNFGWNVSDCGDVNGDGFEDVIVGAPSYNSNQGRAYIIFGGPSFEGDLAADSADVILEGSWANALFGWDVSGAGDFNGDGINETIVGAPGNNSNTGAAYIFYGSSFLSGTISATNANVTIDGENSGDYFGSSVSDLGDVSKENPVDHVVISEVYANGVDETSPDIGEFMELYNPTSAPIPLDNWVIEDNDGHSFTLFGTIPANGFFLIAVDNYLGSTDPTEASWPPPDFDCGYTAGSVFANSGDEIRIKDDTGAVIDTFGYSVNAEWYEGTYHPALPNPWESYERKLGETSPTGGNAIDTDNNGNDFAVRSAAEPQNTASAIEIPPNQSIYDDVIIGAHGWGNDKGRAYVFYGSSGNPVDASSADVILTGESDNDLFGFTVSGAGDVNSDGFDDILVGAPGYNNNRGRSYIYHGAQNMSSWTQDMIMAHWDESTGAVFDIANVYAIYEKRWLAQSFTPDQDYLLTKVWLYLDNIGDTTISISLEGDNNGPDGVILALANPKPNIPPGPNPLTWMEFEFTNPFQATAGTMYWITARATGKNTNNCWGWLQDLDSNPNYSGGYSAFLINPPGTWTEEPDYDYWFKVMGKLPGELTADVTLTGEIQGDRFGWSVSDAGDIGGDGFDDVILGAPETANGNAYLINGSTIMKDVTVAGIDWGDEKQRANWETGGDMEAAVYSGQFVAQSFIAQETYLQTNVSLLIKAFGTSGTLTVMLMGSSGSSPDTVPDGTVLAQAPSISTGNVSYEWAVFEWMVPYICTAGTEYFIVGEGTGADTSNCWGWFGQRGGNYPDGDSAYDQGGGWTAYDADFYFREFGKSETALPNITFSGESPGDKFGYSVSDAGNFNGDAYDDVVVGAPENGNGKVYLFNCSNVLPITIQAINANYSALGENLQDRFGWSVSRAGDINQSMGYDEVIVGTPYQDPSGISDAGKAYILSMPVGAPIPPVVDLPFRINNDAEFAAIAAAEGWVGDGSAGNPYIIENYDIDGGGYGYCIYIGNTTVSFVIRDCNLYNSSGNPGIYNWDSGIALYNSMNGTLKGNTFENCTGNALHIVGSTNISISQNDFLNSTGSGIYLESSVGNNIDDNTFDNNNYGLEMNSNSDSNIITNNSFTNNSEAMDLWSCDGNIISGNYGDNNGMFAYLFSWCNGNEFLNNTIVNSNTGIYLQSNCNGNTIQNNTISDINQEGIIIESSSSNVLEGNDVQRCDTGLYTILASLNIISNNTFSNNTDYGIYLDPSSDQNTISNNTIAYNGIYGILLISADLNVIIYNDIFNNSEYGIDAEGTTNDNQIHHNIFSDNNGGDVQAFDDGTDNRWNDTSGEGNLWGDYEDRYVPPASSNGIVWDIPYDINGSAGAQDLFPLALYPWYQDLRIDNDTDFADTAAFFGWIGDGSSSNPYIIEGLTIDAGGLGYGIYIGNTTANFIIRNCSIENSNGNSNQFFRNSGIYLFNVTNGILDNNEIKACDGNGINIEYSKDIVVTNNTCRYNNWSGIYTGYYSNITISNNTCNFNNWSGVYLWSTNDSFVINNTCLNNSDGITLEYSDNNLIADNVLNNNSWEGIYADNSHLNTITDNTCLRNYDGLYLYYSDNNTVSGNQFSNNTQGGFGGTGIFLDHGDYNDILNNTCSGNKEDGIYIFYSDFSFVDNNTCQDNPNDGISVYKSINCTISNNTVTGNQFGILLENRCFDIIIENNNISYNLDDGIYFLILCINNTIRNNTIEGNGDDGIYMNDRNRANLIDNNTISKNGGNGINLTDDSDEFIIIYNIIANNTEYGLQILDNDCENSLIHHNGFYFNNGSGVQAYDNGSNTWDDGYPSGGNFWTDYIGVDFNSTPTQDVPPPDGFGDTPYDIDGPKGAKDRYPLITFPWSPPPPVGLPEISNVTALPDPQETGGFVNITCNVTDSDGVSEVWVNVTLPSGGFINSSLNKGTGDFWFLNSPYSILGVHDFVIWAKDVAGIWNGSIEYTFTIQDTTPPMIFNVLNLPDPQEVGGSVNITCDVTDNVGVMGVWVNISLPDGGFTNTSMIKDTGNQWFYEAVYMQVGGYSFTIWANDSSGNWGISINNNFQILDTTSPVISNVLDIPDPQLTGGSVNITCDVTDNFALYEVWVNISLPAGGYINSSMIKGPVDQWFLDSIYIPLGIYNYVIWANDTENNWASSSGHTFTIFDGNSPVISDVLDIPDPQEIGGLVNITCNVTDDVGVLEVWVNITLPSGGYSNVSMNKGASDEWFLESPYIALGAYDYVIWAGDTSSNWVSSTGHSFTIQDTTLPVISNVIDTPDPQEVGGAVNITCDVMDNVEIFGVWVNITSPGGGFVNLSMTKGVGDGWFHDSIYPVLGLHDYVIWAKDSSDNWASSSGYSFLIQDTTLPSISNVMDVPDPQEVDGNVNISCEVTDNVEVSGVWVNIMLPGGGTVNISMTKGPGDTWFYDIPYTSLGTHDYVIWANDTSGNWIFSSGHSFLIQDTIPPVISNVLDDPDPQEILNRVNITCEVTDNVQVYDVWVNITSPGGGSINISMTKGPGDTWFYDAPYVLLGIHYYVIWANDTSGNWIGSSGHIILVHDTTLPVISNVVATPDPQDVGERVNITCEVTDNVELFNVWIYINLPGGGFVNVSMTTGAGDIWYNDTIRNLVGIHDYLIWANDTQGNWNFSSGHGFTIQQLAPYDIILISGDGQSGTVGTQLGAPFIVEVRDKFGNPVPNADVWFNITLGGGSIDISSPISTDNNGRGQVNLTLGTTSGTNTVTAEIAGLGINQVVFSAFGDPDIPDSIVIISGDGQIGTVGTQLAFPLVIEVHDQYGNPVPGTNVWFNATAGFGILSTGNPVLTNGNGRAQTQLTLGTFTGLNAVTAEIVGNGITQVIFIETGIPGAPHDIVIISGNGQIGTVGTRLAQPFVVEVTDIFGNPVPNAPTWFNITNGDGSLDSVSPIITDANGRAQVNMTLGEVPEANSVSAEISGLGITQVVFSAVGITNRPEIITHISNIELTEDDPPYTLNLFASALDDEDLPQDLDWIITDFNSSLYSIGGQGTNTLVIIPKPNMFGNDNVTLWVSDSQGLSDSQPLWINITPVNDKPYFFPEPPDLTITKDIPYTFNYAPYIHDIDNTIDELTITTDDPGRATPGSPIITYLYPSSMVGQQVFVTLTVSDGLDSSSVVIRINVTEDNVPVLKSELPDIIMYEDETKLCVFDLDEYFYDPDGDAVYYSYGYSHIKIIINDNNSVDFISETDWYGQETVIFRARDPNFAIVEDSILVTVFPVNDPPIISGVPDLVVHYDADYFFDLSPYITDADNINSDLSLTFLEYSSGTWNLSENISVSLDNNLKMMVNYSIDYLGNKIQVQIEVFDGTDSAWETINITVSEDWPPELHTNIPDIIFDEDEYLSDHINVNNYFIDRDGDALFFTYGQEHVQIIIYESGSVDFFADENWFGMENITIRATDPSGALVEDIIIVTVLPVNDAPVIENIPHQEGIVGTTWVLDLRPYLDDVDNNITELEIFCDSPYVTVVGTVLVFQYPSDVTEDIVQIIVRDPDSANATTAFNVTLTKLTAPGKDEFDIMPFIWTIILIIIVIIMVIILYIYQKGKYEVEEVLLVFGQSGLLISHKYKGEEADIDRDLMASLFTAIQDFVNDVFESGDSKGTRLNVMEIGDRKVMIERGKYTYLAAVFKGGTWRLETKLKATVEDLETEYSDVFQEWEGDMEDFKGIEEYLDGLVTT